MEEQVALYAMTHKLFELPKDKLYKPLFVGYENHKDSIVLPEDYLSDAVGDNISRRNPYYSELTGVYWVWKNITDCKVVGICHYRRYFQNAAGKLFDEKQILQILSHYDVMTTKKVILDHSYIDGFSGKHNRNDLLVTEQVIKEKYPDYYTTYHRLVNQNTTYFGNMMICSKRLFDAYAKWLFDILFEVENRIDISSYNDYQKRVFGFISELLLMVYLTYNEYKVYECDVAVIGEKKETEETKQKIAEFLAKEDVSGAKDYFMSIYQRRPDILMEASDTKGELKLCMQIITTLLEEKSAGVHLTEEMRVWRRNLPEMLEDFRTLNRYVSGYVQKDKSAEKLQEKSKVILNKNFSNIAYIIALKITFPYDIKIQEQFYKEFRLNDVLDGSGNQKI